MLNLSLGVWEEIVSLHACLFFSFSKNFRIYNPDFYLTMNRICDFELKCLKLQICQDVLRGYEK